MRTRRLRWLRRALELDVEVAKIGGILLPFGEVSRMTWYW